MDTIDGVTLLSDDWIYNYYSCTLITPVLGWIQQQPAGQIVFESGTCV